MGLPRTFVGFSSTDLHYYRLMQAWKRNMHTDFNFTDCQLEKQINSEDERYIKSKVCERIDMAGTYVMLIGQDTRYKYKYVKWEAEVALDKGCSIIGVNLDGSRQMVKATCPPVIRDVGAVFVPFSPKVVNYAIKNFHPRGHGSWYYGEEVYDSLGLNSSRSLWRDLAELHAAIYFSPRRDALLVRPGGTHSYRGLVR